MSWKYIDELLLKLGKNSTVLGKFWIVSVLVFRLLVLTAFGDHIWSDEQREFTCNTRQPGCENVCFNIFTPVSNIRMWGLQMLAVSIPGLFYFLYVMHVMSQTQLIRSRFGQPGTDRSVEISNEANKSSKDLLSNEKPKASKVARKRWELLRGHVIPPEVRSSRIRCVWKLYFMQIFFRIGIEIFFSLMQYTVYFYNWTIPEVFACSRWPCPHTVDCFISRPKEKTIFFRYMFAVSALSVLISVFELLHLLWARCRDSYDSKRTQLNYPPSEAIGNAYTATENRRPSLDPRQPPLRKKSLNSFSSMSEEISIPPSNTSDCIENEVKSSNIVSYL